LYIARSLASPQFNAYKKEILGLTPILDSLQVLVFEDKFGEVVKYPSIIRRYVPVIVEFVDYITVGPGGSMNGNAGVGEAVRLDDKYAEVVKKALAVSLRYEVGNVFASLERMKLAAEIEDSGETCNAYGALLLHFDRFLKYTSLYPFYNPVVSNEVYYDGIKPDQLVFDKGGGAAQCRLKDRVVIVSGVSMGRTGTVVGVYKNNDNRIVKLDELGGNNGDLMKGIREIVIVEKEGCRRRVDGDPDAVFLKGSMKGKVRNRI